MTSTTPTPTPPPLTVVISINVFQYHKFHLEFCSHEKFCDEPADIIRIIFAMKLILYLVQYPSHVSILYVGMTNMDQGAVTQKETIGRLLSLF